MGQGTGAAGHLPTHGRTAGSDPASRARPPWETKSSLPPEQRVAPSQRRASTAQPATQTELAACLTWLQGYASAIRPSADHNTDARPTRLTGEMTLADVRPSA